MADDEAIDFAAKRICVCDERMLARYKGEFVFMEQYAAWVFTDSVPRWMSPAAQFRAFIDRSEYDHENHIGEPMRWVSCPWCGGDLPPQDSFNPFLQGDGTE